MNRSLLAAPAIAALLFAGVTGIASAGEDTAAEPSAECTAAQTSLDEGKDTVAARDGAAATLASARAEARTVVGIIAPDFPVDTATASDVQVAIDESLRPVWQGYPEGSAEYTQWERIVNVAKSLRDAINAHHAALSAAVTVDISALTVTRDEACADDVTTTTPPAPDETSSEAPAPPAQIPAGPPYADCDAARADGAAPITVGNPGYRPALDRDGDAVACEPDDGNGVSGTGDGTAVLGGVDDSNSGVVTSIPVGSIDTGYVA